MVPKLSQPTRRMTTQECLAECDELSRQTIAEQSELLDRISSDRSWLPDIIGTLHARAVPGFDGWFAAFIQCGFASRQVRLVVFRGEDTSIGESWTIHWERVFCKPLSALFANINRG